ncbi:MAG: hypothetical protein DIZ80_02155 [endosymbiont of Galathealinum brachiosum]|uniref:histidine kinase n=1 Tax=endosymbiont of Galathealinum brachiosum TaxID=2200906 RepID=A0A370DK05_9GAMM|nr:MAG: hypothetical protein DIZ80_02155 [endosymbiont of Galathealinum brachiosum]
MLDKSLTSDWTTGWYGSLSVKITSIVLWGIAIIGASIAVVLVWNSDTEIRLKFDHYADTIALTASHDLFQSVSAKENLNWDNLMIQAKSLGFTGMTINFNHSISYRSGETNSDNKIIRKLYYHENQKPKVANLTLYHLPFERLQSLEQKRLLLTTVAICLVFGLLLNWIIQKILANPFQALLEATKKISEGQMDLRLDDARQDEFGQLARFFNKMMDQISAQQNFLKETTKQAESATRAKSTFIANMSHELRTPLNSIIGFTSTVKEGMAGEVNKEQVLQLNKAHSSAKHLLSLINELLDLSKIEAGKADLNIKEFNVAELVTEVTDMLKPLCEKKSLRLQVECNNCGLLSSDQMKIRQILIILIDNAIKFTQSGSISVKSWLENNKVWFEVKDTGSGIKVSNIDIIFTPFYQEDSKGDKQHDGSGLGLAICKQFLDMLSGDIEVISVQGKGSRFIFNLPESDNHE